MSRERKIDDDELVEISGGVDGPYIEIDDEPRSDGPVTDRPSDSGSPGGPGPTTEENEEGLSTA